MGLDQHLGHSKECCYCCPDVLLEDRRLVSAKGLDQQVGEASLGSG